jgi:hypothetical protein
MLHQNLIKLTSAEIQELLRSDDRPNWATYATDTLIEASLAVDSNLSFFDVKDYRGTADQCDTRNRMLAIQCLDKYFDGATANASVDVVEEVAIQATAGADAQPEVVDVEEDFDEDDSSEDSEEDSDDSDEEEEEESDEDSDEDDSETELMEIIELLEQPVQTLADVLIESLDEEQLSDLTEILVEHIDGDDSDDEIDLDDDEDDEDSDEGDEDGEFDNLSDVFYADQSSIAANLVIVLSAADTAELFPHRNALATVKSVDVAGEDVIVDMVRGLTGLSQTDTNADNRKGLLVPGLIEAFEHVEHFNSRDLLVAAGSSSQFVRAVNALAARLSDEVLVSFQNSFDNLGLADFNLETENGSFNAGSFVSVRASVAPVTSDSTVSTAITVFVQLRIPGMFVTRLRDTYIQSIVDYVESNDINTPVTLMVSANATDLLFNNKLVAPATPKNPAKTYDLQNILKQTETTQMYGFQTFSMPQLLDIAESLNRAHESDLILDSDDSNDIESLDIDSTVGGSTIPEADFNLSILPLNGSATGILPWGDTHVMIADLNAGSVEEDEEGDSDDMEGLDFSDDE